MCWQGWEVSENIQQGTSLEPVGVLSGGDYVAGDPVLL